MEKKYTITYVDRKQQLLKLLLLVIPIIIFIYLIAANFFIDQEFNYFYDIGGEEDKLKPYLTPLNRTSEIYESSENYRNITHRLIYFSIPFIQRATNVSATLQFRTNINSSITLGVKNNTGWNYTWYYISESIVSSGGWTNVGYIAPLDAAYTENNRLSLAFDIFGISKIGSRNDTFFSIDWINLTVYKLGVLG